eukprot:1142935-Pelagomonas_calceolata.AAC.1
MINFQGCQQSRNKGQGLLGFWLCCSLPHSRIMQHSTHASHTRLSFGTWLPSWHDDCSPMPSPRA